MNKKQTYRELKNEIVELQIVNKTLGLNLSIQGEEKKKRAAELVIANVELEYQSGEKKKRAAEFTIANIEKDKAEENEIYLSKLNATKDKLFAIIAHDLHSPFNCILGLTEMLIGNFKDYEEAEVEEFLGNISFSAKNTLVLLDNLLNWAKSITGQLHVVIEKLVLSSVIQEIFALSSISAKNKNISLNYSDSEKIIVFADLNMLKLIIRNLISNAIKFTNLNGEIIVFASKKDNFIEIAVSDNGVGMDEGTRNKLLSLDTHETAVGTAHEKGSGLGLMLCREFVEKLGGEIWVQSELGKGSVFKFSLPLG